MDTHLLIDAIVRQTTVLIAHLATAAGIRAPLARVADQVFLDLTREIEAQGVGRKVVADMFGMALRTYQKKTARLTQSAEARDGTLWEAVLDYLRKSKQASRAQLGARFKRDDPHRLAAVLRDLVSTGMVCVAGKGEEALYTPVGNGDLRALEERKRLETVTNLTWLSIYDRRRVARAQLVDGSPFGRELAEKAVISLINDGRVTCVKENGTENLSCSRLTIPVGGEQGWEAAVFDHFRTVSAAIAAKVRSGATRSRPQDTTGGATLLFSIYPGHPFEKQVYSLLQRVRTDVNQLWDQVSSYNRTHPVDPDTTTDVSFYFGQSVIEADNNTLYPKGDRS